MMAITNLRTPMKYFDLTLLLILLFFILCTVDLMLFELKDFNNLLFRKIVFEDAYLMVGELAIEGNCIFYLISDMMKLNVNQLDNP